MQGKARSKAESTLDARQQKALEAEDWTLLAKLCKQHLRKDVHDLQATRLLGYALDCLGKADESVEVYRRAALMWPRDAELLINYGNVLLNHARNADALPILQKVCELRPDKAICWIKLSQCCYLLSQHEKGFDTAKRAVALATHIADRSAALTATAIHRRELGQVKEAVQDCVDAIALTPMEASNHTNRLLFMLADPDTNSDSLSQAAREYAAVFEPSLKPLWPDFANHRGDPWRKLRIGFLSPDFRTHSVMYFVEGLLAQLDRRQFEVFAFYLFPRDDKVTARVQKHADHFVRLSGLNPKQQADAVRSQGIDILIDLAGHTGHNGLMCMAHKAAPVQATWIGYPGTTGLTAVDYLITDSMTDPAGVDAEYSEQLYRLPTRLCVYRPMSRNPLWRYQPRYLVQQTPAIANGFITFGSCNNLGKITDDVLRVWATLLKVTPGSRLLIEGKNLDRSEFAASYRNRCESMGIEPSRLDLIGLSTDNQYLTYHKIDIALDPFPLNGGTTSMDVLWMGVPLVAMEGQSFKSRLSAGILLHLGRQQWLAKNIEEYVNIASTLAADVINLNQLRQSLRDEVENSVLMREDVFCKNFGIALRNMWLTWQSRIEHPSDTTEQTEALRRWQVQEPIEWTTEDIPGVGLAPGKRVGIHEAHQKLEEALAIAKANSSNAHAVKSQIENPYWTNLTELAETVLNSVPHDPVALACLAEVEFAHGHSEFAVTYLRYATESMTRSLR